MNKSVYNIETPVEFIALYDDFIRSGKNSLHKWQLEQLLSIGEAKPSAKHPYQLALVAANGSGKDKYIIAPTCLWFILSRKNALCIVTSSSAQQLDKQTERYMRALAQQFNALMKEEILRVVKRHITCEKTGGEIILFATDEAGKAEGYHPTDPDSDMMIVVNEAKSVPEEIFEALTRCSGFNYWLEISSPGQPSGHFYESARNPEFQFRRVTSYDCTHISPEEIERDEKRLGCSSTLFRSKHLALFTSLDQQVILTKELIDKFIQNLPERVDGKRRGGLDFGAGGDETVSVVIQGNTLLAMDCFVSKDTTYTVERVKKFFEQWQVKPDDVTADDNNVGRAMLDTLRDVHKFPCRRFMAQWAAINKQDFLNRGAEIWYKFAKFYERGLIRLLIDPKANTKVDTKLYEQLTTRRYLQPSGGKIRLISKQQMKADGFHSPDRADALILAFVGVQEADLLPKNGIQQGENLPEVGHSVFSTKSLVKHGSAPSGVLTGMEQPEQKRPSFLKHPGLLMRHLYKTGVNSNDTSRYSSTATCCP